MTAQRDPPKPLAPSAPAGPPAASPASPGSRSAFDPFAATPASRTNADPFATTPASRTAFDPFAARPATRPPGSGAFDPFAARPAARTTVPNAPQATPAAPVAPTAMPPRAAALATVPATPLVRAESEFAAVARQMRVTHGLSPAELADLETVLQRRQFGAGSHIVRQGEPADVGGIVGAGRGHMRYETPGRPPVQFGSLRPGMLIGDGAVSGGGYHGASVVADSDCTVWTFTAGDVARLRTKNLGLFNKLQALVRDQQAGR
ncbi:MAG: cyclic nucleotide-binding domain-containing protein [Deltaproteobacteria bacterium]|nr:cyclic nucleotide-binding domain-containing protein [Deltaproteobacteria bacterium]